MFLYCGGADGHAEVGAFRNEIDRRLTAALKKLDLGRAKTRDRRFSWVDPSE
jgi:hypothetical protein